MSDLRWADIVMPDQPVWVRDLVEHKIDTRDKRISALEKVAEAAVPLCKAIGNTTEYSSLWWVLDDALREAGYQKEQGL